MADHVRKQIRDEALQTLAGLGLATSGTNRVHTISDADLPAGFVMTEDETSETVSLNGVQQRSLELAIVVVVGGADPDGIDDELDSYAAQVETELESNPPAAVRSLVLERTTLDLQPDEEGHYWYGFAVLVFTATYFTRLGNPTETAR